MAPGGAAEPGGRRAPGDPRAPSGRGGATSPQPVALLYGRGRLIVHANPAFVLEFGATCLGLPATEALPDWPRRAFDVIDRAFETARPVAAWVTVSGSRRRLTVAPRTDLETGEIYGVAIRLAAEEPRD